MRRWPLSTLAVFTLLPMQALACEIALALAVDISGSVDRREFKTQMNGLALGLLDPTVSETLVKGGAQIALIQWTGSSRQALSIPWSPVNSHADLVEISERIAETPRAWRNFSTAIGEALRFTQPIFDQVLQCDRKVIDVSGDGTSNEGIEPAEMRAALWEAGITVNALVIEGEDFDLTGYFWENVIVGDGAFVVTANGFEEYPEKMRQKLLRELTKPISWLHDNEVIPAAQTVLP